MEFDSFFYEEHEALSKIRNFRRKKKYLHFDIIKLFGNFRRKNVRKEKCL